MCGFVAHKRGLGSHIIAHHTTQHSGKPVSNTSHCRSIRSHVADFALTFWAVLAGELRLACALPVPLVALAVARAAVGAGAVAAVHLWEVTLVKNPIIIIDVSDLTELWICLGSTRSRFSPMTALSVRGSASLSFSTPMYHSPLSRLENLF